MEKIRILLIEDIRLLRETINAILRAEPDFEVITPPESFDTLYEAKIPNVALLDFRLPIQNSLNLMVSIKRKFSEMKCIAMNVLPDEVDIFEIVKAGGSGFILRDASNYDFINTIRKVIKGEKVLPPVLTHSLFSQIVNNATNPNKINVHKPMKLTRREQEIIGLISEGLSNKEIAQRLHIATYTVKSHVHNILEKLGLNTRLQVAIYNHTKQFPLTIHNMIPSINYLLFLFTAVQNI